MKDKDLKLLKQLLQLKESSIYKVLLRYLNSLYDRVYSKENNYIYAPGDIPIALVSHADTVFENPPRIVYYDPKEKVMIGKHGIGADDRAGIFAILKLLQQGYKPTVIICWQEEIGALGAENFIQDFPKLLSPVNYMIEIDREGFDQVVFYDCDNQDFEKYINSFGFTTHQGIFSDISVLAPFYGIAACNVSAGYLDQHTSAESLHLIPLEKTIYKVKKMLKEPTIPSFDFIPNAYYGYYKYAMGYGYGYNEEFYGVKCDKCGCYMESYEAIPVGDKVYCPDCCIEDVSWCVSCGQAFESKGDDSQRLCPSCRNSKKKKKNKKGKKK